MFKILKLPAGGETAVIALIVAIISLMILPLPAFIIDLLLGINIAISVTLLMASVYAVDAIALSTFPSLLLFTTLYRLSLNIASTKSILLHAEAGHIIDSFGELVVGGNLVVGLVVFAIITTVQFIVIAKGSERVAEVGARFTLDALPGKQMSIDADLRANHLTADEARTKRAKLALESQLHGSMDGAMKFVKGDAIAGLIITVINIVAGIAVGVAYHGMSAGEAANRFSILSIGDAMVSQIPSLLLSVAAGIIITRVSDDRGDESPSLGELIGQQLSASSRALYFSALLLIGFALVPGFPSTLFVILASALAFAAYRLNRKSGNSDAHAARGGSSTSYGAKSTPSTISPRAPQFACAIGVRLSPDLAETLSTAVLDRALSFERTQVQESLGLPCPEIAMWTHPALPSMTCEILVHDVPRLTMQLPAGRVMIIGNESLSSDDQASIQSNENFAGVLEASELGPSVEVGGPPSRWIGQRSAPSNLPVRTVEQVIAYASINLIRQHAPSFLGIQEVQKLLEVCNTDYPGLVAEVQKVLPAQRIADVLQRLLEEQVSIRNMRLILQSLITWGPKEKDMLMLTEYVRGDMSQFIAHQAAGGAKTLKAIVFDSALERHIRQSIKQTPTGNFLVLPPDEATELIESIENFAGDEAYEEIALVTSMDIRRYVRKMIERRLQKLKVYSYQELGEHVDLQPLGRVAL